MSDEHRRHEDHEHHTNSSAVAAAAAASNINSAVAPFLSKHIPQQHAIQLQKRSASAGNKYCYRHQPGVTCRRQADELTMEKLQKDLENLPSSDQEAISHVWSVFSAAPATQRNLILRGILTQCCSPQLSLISAAVRELIRIDFLVALPTELAFKVLSYLDTQSLCKAAQVSRRWRILADDDVVWHKMCKQHIDRKCTKCGWGLPLLERKRLRAQPRIRKDFFEQQMRQGVQPRASLVGTGAGGGGESSRSFLKRDLSALSLGSDADGEDQGSSTPSKRVCRDNSADSARDSSPESESGSCRRARHWKDIYSERYKVESNWRKGRCTKKVFKGHTNGIMCLQFDDNYLATGSYDTTVKIWDLETGKELRTLSGHTSGVRALQFDDSKLISGSMDNTLKIWNWKTGDCVRTLGGHTAGVVCLHFQGDLLVSGSVDCSIRGWNFRTGDRFVLKGHSDWVNSVRIHLPSNTLFSASDDTTVRVWDLETKACVRTFSGHVGQVQQVIPMALDPSDFEPLTATVASSSSSSEDQLQPPEGQQSLHPSTPSHILTAALDSQVRVWDVAQGKCVRTLFGHIEGVWALAADSLRVISGAEDRLVKVWDLRTAKCQRTVADHAAAVTCVQLSDSRMISGSEDGEAWMYCFKAGDTSSSSSSAQRKNLPPIEVAGSEGEENY